MAAVPMYWDRVLPGTSDWQAEMAQKQQAIESALGTNGKLDDIQQQHTQPTDPCNMGRFIFEDAKRGAADISKLAQLAQSKQASNQKDADDAIASVDSHVADLASLDLPSLKADLQASKEEIRTEIQTASGKLEELVSTDAGKRKGRDEVLQAEYGAGAVQSAQAEAKAKMYKEVRNDRIDQRMQTTISGSEKLYDDTEWLPKLENARGSRKQIFDIESSANQLHQEAGDATQKKHEVESIVADIECKQQAGVAQLAECKQEKMKTNSKLDETRTRIIAALQELKAANTAYTDAYIENELLRAQIGSLDSSLKDIDARKSAAKAASEVAVKACEEWQEKAIDNEDKLRKYIDSQATNCQESIMVLARTVTYNTVLAKSLLANVIQDNEGQMSSIRSNIEAKVSQQESLQAELLSEEPERDIDDVESMLAMAKDEEKTLKQDLAKAEKTKDQLQSKAKVAQTKLDKVILFYVGERISDQDVADASAAAYDLWRGEASVEGCANLVA